MGFYEDRIFPTLLDWVMDNHVMDRQRARTVCRADGVVLEVGAGSGLNRPFIDTRRVNQWIALEPSAKLRSRLRARTSDSPVDVEILEGIAENLPLASASVDSVVMTYTLCSVHNPALALAEIHRVLKPGGRVFFSEHGLAPDGDVRRLQRLANPAWKTLACGCRLDRDVQAAIEPTPFETSDVQSAYMPGPRLLSYTTWGSLRKVQT